MKKFERAKALLSNRNGPLSYEAVLEAALDEFLKDHDPEERKRRREERKEKVSADRGVSRRIPSAAPGERTEASRYIPAAVRDAVFARDKGRCTYTGPDGKRCGSTHNLQIDHIVPFACGGTALIHNLRLLCGKHNRLSAERIFGPRAPGRRL